LLFIIWIALTNSFDWQELLVGGLVAMLISLIAVYIYRNDKSKTSLNPIKIIHYIIIFFKNLIISNIDVARIVLNPKLPINPGIVKIKTALDTDFKKLILANSITLTPGTITLEILDDHLFIHWINVTTDDMNKASDIIKGDFEKILA